MKERQVQTYKERMAIISSVDETDAFDLTKALMETKSSELETVNDTAQSAYDEIAARLRKAYDQ